MPITVNRATPPDLRVTNVDAPLRVRSGQEFTVTYTVMNFGGDTPISQGAWDDLLYLSRDLFLDVRADRFMDTVRHLGGLAAGQSYTITRTLRAPAIVNETEEYYVFVSTDPPRTTSYGSVFELDKETNNDRATTVPLVIELPPPSDLVVTSISVPVTAQVGDPITFSWTVKNQSCRAGRRNLDRHRVPLDRWHLGPVRRPAGSGQRSAAAPSPRTARTRSRSTPACRRSRRGRTG